MICLPQEWFTIYSLGIMCCGASFVIGAIFVLLALSFAKAAKIGDREKGVK
jgi:hypothetical protein